MAFLLLTLQKSRISPFLSSGTLIPLVRCISLLPIHPSRDIITSAAKSPFRSNILRIINTVTEYQSDYAPPHQPATKFKSFSVVDCPDEQCIVMKGKFGEEENIKMEATMFDGFMSVPRTGLDASRRHVCLHINLLINISKIDGSEEIEFLCSVWPNCMEIQKLYKLRRNKISGQPYMRPNFGYSS